MLRTAPSVPVVGEVVSLNAGEVERALAYWADEASINLVGMPLEVRDSYHGKEQVRLWFKCLVAKHFQIRVKVIKVQGDIVATRTESRSDLTRQMGIAALITTEVYVVNEGKIARLTLTIPPGSRLRFTSALHKEGGVPPHED